tara:strand:+ start:2317 stop:7008 length:4692 start_codon:yes stop_codon:yes gene_type:complete
MNWNKFAIKNENKEQWAFEQMAYLLFCSEFNNNIGLFRYKNQTGIETEPLKKDGIIYGFSAKYYEVSVNDRKKEIIEAITKAKSKNPEIDVIYFYINQELSESSLKDRKKASYEVEIDEACEKLSVSLEWRVPSHFELQLALPKHKYIHDLFFSLDPTLDKLRDSVFAHNASILNAIRTEISVSQQQIKIERQNYLSEIEELTSGNKHIILSGEGGSGKTAILKEFYQQHSFNIPICIFKATELNVNHVSDLFRFEHNFSSADFFSTYENETTKLFIIDSAEKLADLSNQNVLHDLVNSLTTHGWTIVFTTRTSYLDDLNFHINESYQLQCEILEVELLSDEKLIKLSDEFGIVLPSNNVFKDRLRNLFYLNEYISHYQSTETVSDFASFIDLLWKKRIQNSLIKKDNIHIKRGRCLEKIAKQRADTNRFYVTGDSLPQDALYQLKADDILGYDEQHDGYFITHDIYEEWALNHIINKTYQNHVDIEDFFRELGNSLAIRRAFRLWLSQKLIEEDTDIKRFINNVFVSDISQFWKDELLVSVLLSEYSFEFFELYENELIANDFSILKRIIFLLQVACKDVVSMLQNTRPKGRGWQATIGFIYKHYFDFFESNRNRALPILLDWCQSNTGGETTRLTGLLAISILKKTEQGEHIYFRNEDNDIYKVVFASCREIEDEIKEIFDKVIKHTWVEHNDPYQDFCVTILNKCYLAIPLIQLLPNSIIELCRIFWTEKKNIDPYRSLSFNMDSETDYGLREYGFNYYPASAHQTPMYFLLQTKSFLDAIDFIISFTNSAVAKYAQSDTGKKDVNEVKIYIQDNEVTQYNSFALWTMYRGFGSPATPELLQSIHMALEKFLLNLAEQLDSKIVQTLLFKILKNSTSTSVTSVVCSVVLAHHNKFYEVALVLFKSIDLFYYDLVRSRTEFEAKSLYGMGYGLNSDLDNILYRDERLKTCNDKHRNLNLEHLCLHYQFHGVKDFSEEQNSDFIDNIFKIIDQYKSELSDGDETTGILLARMDRRNLEPEIIEEEEQTKVAFIPKLTEKQKRISETAQVEYNERFKYTPLDLWANFSNDKEYEGSKKYKDNPLLASEDTKNLLNKLENTSDATFIQLNRNIPFHSCPKLIIEYSHLLPNPDKDLCKEIIEASIERLFLDNYEYQIGDGLEACTHALPKLIEEYPHDIEKLALLLIFILFDKRSIGMYKRVCDYAIEAIHQKGLWDSSPQVAEQIVNGFIQFKPLFNNAIEALQSNESQKYNHRILKSEIFEKFLELCKSKEIDDQLDRLRFNSSQLDYLDIDDLETIYQLMPNDTKNEDHLSILNLTLSNIAKILLKNRHDTTDINNLYSLRLSIFKKISAISLHRNSEDEVKSLLEPFINNLKRNDETEQFIERFIWSENEFYQPKVFWYVWKLLYPKIIELYNQGGYYKDFENLLVNYLLAWRWWGEKQKEWRSLTKENLWLYDDISKDLGNHPSVLYSIARALNSVASNFHNLGIDWINTIASNNHDLKLGNVESDTLFNLENYLRQYVFLNRQRIKQDVRLKTKVINILDFMVERGSVHGYLLRESIL